jgi:hypothetical protein
MKKVLLIILVTLSFVNCKEKTDKFTFDDSKVSFIEDYFYEYDGDKEIQPDGLNMIISRMENTCFFQEIYTLVQRIWI